MLNDWEEHELADIERELRSDPGLARVLAAPTGLERAWLAFKARFYPSGYLLCALTYEILVMGHGQRGMLAWTSLVAACVGVVIEARATGTRAFVVRGLRGMAGS